MIGRKVQIVGIQVGIQCGEWCGSEARKLCNFIICRHLRWSHLSGSNRRPDDYKSDGPISISVDKQVFTEQDNVGICTNCLVLRANEGTILFHEANHIADHPPGKSLRILDSRKIYRGGKTPSARL